MDGGREEGKGGEEKERKGTGDYRLQIRAVERGHKKLEIEFQG